GDGAPDPDNDGDGVADVNDNCPMVAGSPENAGCKKPQLVVIRGCSFDLTEKVYFRTARATIESRSYSLLDNIAELMKAQPQIERIRVEGHTDSRGSAAGNKRLSQARAEAVVAYLVKAGVAAERLEAVGFGEEKPIDSNATSKGREANRRVEIVIADCNVETETR
ncbi:MAG: OmpA family protein, partial [Myxococcota bacterium]